jgi:hypothetical protein
LAGVRPGEVDRDRLSGLTAREEATFAARHPGCRELFER